MRLFPGPRRYLHPASAVALVAVVASGAALTLCAPAVAQGEGSQSAAEIERTGPPGGSRDPLDVLLERVDAATVRDHQFALQQIASLHGGTRAAGTPGYDASVAYVAERLTAAGYSVTLQSFAFNAWIPLSPPVVEQLVPTRRLYAEGVDFELMSQSDAGDVAAFVQGVDLRLGAPATSTSGCEASDFAGFPQGAIALLQRGACAFRQKAENAAAAGAVAAVICNQGDSAERRGLFDGSVTRGYTGGIPVFATSFNQGLTWAQTAGLELRLTADVFRGPRQTVNVIAETLRGRPGRVVMAGAHLDSVLDGPGLQDNGSGSAALLAVAEALAGQPPRNTVRFAWWGAEEAGLVGSYHYVNTLSPEALGGLALYLNFDMIGSPNFVRFILDGDGSTFGDAGPSGSAAVEASFADFFASRDLPFEPARLSGRSDYAAFQFAGVPVGGLFTGAEGIKSVAQAIVYGGTPGEAFDPCYHAACDDFDNVAVEALEDNVDAAANTLFLFAADRLTLPAPAKNRRRPGPPPHDEGCQAHAEATLE